MLGELTFDGTPIPGHAFGMNLCDAGQVRGQAAPEYFFAITVADGRLRLELDTYSANFGRFHGAGDDFDVDAWEAGKLILESSPPTRESFRWLHQTARNLLAGNDVRLPCGVYLMGLQS